MKKSMSRLVFLVLLGALFYPSAASALWPPGKGVFPPGLWQQVSRDTTLLRYGNPGWVRKMKLRRERRLKMARDQAALQSLQADDFYLPVLLGGYSDNKISYTAGRFQKHLFDDNPDGTLSEYYEEVSYGQLNIVGMVLGTYQAGQTKSYYSGIASGLNGYFPRNAEGFVTEITGKADRDVDFSVFDNDGPDGEPNSGDDDGYVDGLIVVYAGTLPGEGDSVNLWPHQSTLLDEYTTDDLSASGGPVKVSTYAVVPERALVNGYTRINPIGIIAHEFGHILGLPDLYDRTGYQDYPDFDYSAGLGVWCLMAGGGEGGDGQHMERPTHLSAWCKIQLGWLTPTVLTASGTVTVRQAETAPEALIIWEDGYRSSRYFLIENRQQTGFDEMLPGSGLLVCHVDENQRWGTREFNWGWVNDDETRKLVDLEEADGRDDLDKGANSGDEGDPFPGSGNARAFDDNSVPDARDYDLRPTGVKIGNISDSGPEMTAEVVVPGPAGYVIAYDSQGITDYTWRLDYNSESWGGVLFTTSGAGVLEALDIGFYTDDNHYEIVVYGTFDSRIPGGLLARQTGYARYQGWHTVPLGSYLDLAQGRDFFVSIRSLDHADAVAYDFYSEDAGRTYTSMDGRAFSRYPSNINLRARVRTAEQLITEAVRFKYQTAGPVFSSPAVGLDGTVYVGSFDGFLYAVNPDGTLRWRSWTMGPVSSSPAVGPGGVVYVGSHDGYLYAVSPGGTLRWKFRTGDYIFSSPAVGPGEVIYIGSCDSSLYAVRADGTLKWSSKTGNSIYSSPAVGGDSTVYVGSDDGYLYALDPDGSRKWRYKTRGFIVSSPAVAEDGTVYLGSGDSCVHAVNPDGTRKWQYRTQDEIYSSPALGSDGTIYIGSVDYHLYALNPGGTLKWKYEVGEWVDCPPALGSDGTVYVGGYDSHLHAVSAQGEVLRKWRTGGPVNSCPAIGPDGVVYVGSDDGTLYAFNRKAGLRLANSAWPRFGRNLQSTSCALDASGQTELPAPEKSCDFDGDGRVTAGDVIAFLLRGLQDPGDPLVDWNGDGRYAVSDGVLLMLDIRKWKCLESSILLSAVGELGPGAAVEGLSAEQLGYLEQALDQLELSAEQEEALRLALYGAAEPAGLPQAFSLGQNVPNPFNPSTTIAYSIPKGTSPHVILKVYD
ncbi:MAG: PQQ-binding-like beta-propeller repeat protein, partial [Candidatus Glassbacteria bacterium]|nr:PQQ-binding-like beta-propeller repeat protein [Candidatus Glassbacteria bacterium]